MPKRGEPRVSLFPFMSVLACTIGALVLLLVAMSISAVGATGEAARVDVETKVATEADRAALAEGERELARAEALWERVDALLETRGLVPGISRSSIETGIERAERRQALSKKLDELEDRKRVNEFEKEEIETTIAVLESRRDTLPILIDSTGLSRHLEPFFIECDAEGVTAYRARDDFQYFVAKADLSTSGEFGRYLRRVRAIPGALLVLLVRPDGLATAERTFRIARGAEIRVSRLPLPGKGALDWSLLRKAEGASS